MSVTSGCERQPGEGNGTPVGILVWRIVWTEEPGGYSPQCRAESDMADAS